MGDPSTKGSKRPRRRRRRTALWSVIGVGVLIALLDPWQWWQRMPSISIQGDGTVSIRSSQGGPGLTCHYKHQQAIQRFRYNILQRKDKYAVSVVDLWFSNNGTEPCENVYLSSKFDGGIKEMLVSGFSEAEYRLKDGSYRTIGSNTAPVDPSDIAIRIKRIPPGIAYVVRLTFAHDGKTSVALPVMLVGDDAGRAETQPHPG